ncbi:hypothetical protein GNF76_27165 [Pseudomonas sp. CCM 7893]|uniref:Uncharacterized protein n=1 Tax=Pseudomonas spelaei TaxID=1055469 RepID=A0A6I3WE51_9PSED|nr:hypothetical protein [Pseudomonas spelaei]MUF08028.1 hypothetical protein [Pseudomonas spelaei]
MPTENKVAAPLQVERSTVTKLVITGAPNLDPITVFLEDLAPCKGKITVSCWGKSWTAYWGGMWDGLNVGQFFCELNTSYIIGYFAQGMSSQQFSAEALADKVRREILQMRRDHDLDDSDARDLYDEADDIRHVNSIDSLGGAHHQLMRQVLGDEWWHLSVDATEPNPDWDYLERIIQAVQQALRQDQQAVAA